MLKARLHLIVILLFLSVAIQSNGQTISNVHSEQAGNAIQMHCSLSTINL
jgi:hypothetical protein